MHAIPKFDLGIADSDILIQVHIRNMVNILLNN